MRGPVGFLVAFLTVLLAFMVGIQVPRNEIQAPIASLPTANESVQQSKIIHCGYILYPPYLQKDLKTGQLNGVTYDVFEAIAKTLNWKVEWAREIPVGAEIAELEKGGIDAVCAITGAYDGNMFAQLTYSDYIFIVKNQIYARADDKRFDGPLHFSDLDKPDTRFTGLEGDTSVLFPHMLMPKAQIIALPALSETAQLFENLKYNKADLMMVESAPGMKAMQSNPGTFKILSMQESLPTYAVQVAFLKKDLALRDTFDEAIRFMKLNNQFEPILSKYDPEAKAFVRAN